MIDKRKVGFFTLGCKLNFSESSTIARTFVDNGFERVDFKEKADVYVINTCSVTEIANKKCRNIINRITKREPNSLIIITGCYAQLKPEEIAQIPNVDLILGTKEKFDIYSLVENLEKKQKTEIHIDKINEVTEFNPSYSVGDRTRSFLKVQDGCDYFCSYCTIPLARGKSRNDTIENTIVKAKELEQKGIKEIILTGVNIGDFGRSTSESFFDLVKQLDDVEGIERIRISSIEPNLLTDEIIEFVAQSKKFAPHFHIPLQCGTDNLLKSMKRRYTTSFYSQRVEKIKMIMPNACIAADLIVGVPGETNEEFNATYDFVKELNISYLHIFTYSERDNTLAAKLEGKVPTLLRKERSEKLHILSKEKLNSFYTQNLGKTSLVLFEENNHNGIMFGFTENYIKVEIPYNAEYVNKLIKVELGSINESGNVQAKLI